MNMIITSECLECMHGSESEISNHKVHCEIRNKEYFYGQYIPCENKRSRHKIGENDNE